MTRASVHCKIMCLVGVRTLRVARTSPRLAEVVACRATGSPRSIECAGEREGATARNTVPAVSADIRRFGPAFTRREVHVRDLCALSNTDNHVHTGKFLPKGNTHCIFILETN